MPETRGGEKLVLHNDNFVQNHKQKLKNFLHSQDLSDVTLACKGQFIQSHRLVLAASSPFFSDMFKMCGSKDPIVVLNDVSAYHMKAILQYIYTGECQVQQDDVQTFLKVADSLQIHGLHDRDKTGSVTPSSVATSPVVATSPPVVQQEPQQQQQQQPPPGNEVRIKQEVPDHNYEEDEELMQTGETNNVPPNLPSTPQVPTVQETAAPVVQNPAGGTCNTSGAPAGGTSGAPAGAPADINFPVEPKIEHEELIIDDTHNGEVDPLADQPPIKRIKICTDTSNSTTRDDNADSSRSSYDNPQPGPSNPPSTSNDLAPSTAQDNDRASTRQGVQDRTTFVCIDCNEELQGKASFREHQFSHGRRVTCEHCDVTSDTFDLFSIHNYFEHRDATYL